MTDITFAPTDDLPDIFAMVCALSKFHGDTATVTQDDLNHILFGPCPFAAALLARQGGKAIGSAGLASTIVLHHGRVRIDIHNSFVKDGYRAQGIGKALITQAKNFAIGQNAERLTIATAPDNAVSIAAYRAMPNLTEITGTGPRFCVDLDG